MSSGSPKLYITWKGALKSVDIPVFSTGDSYLLDNNVTVYIWNGANASTDEKEATAVEAHRMEQERHVKVIAVEEGQETAEFLKALEPLGAFRLVEKNLVGSMLADVDTGSWSGHMSHVNALYRISSEDVQGDINQMKYVQVPFEKTSLESNNAFIADLGDEILVWIGKDANVRERMMAGRWAYKFDAERAGAQKVSYFEEGDKDAEFIDKCWGAGIVKASTKFTQFGVEKMKVEPGEHSPKVELKPAPAPAPKPSPAPAPKPELKRTPEPAPKPLPAPAPKLELKQTPEPAQKPASIPTPKPELKRTPEPAPKTAPAPAPKPELKPAPKAEAKVPPKAEEKKAPVPATAAVVEAASGARWQCPKCGNVDRGMIREVTDKNVVLSTYPPIYGKKLICGKCGKEWHQA
jgi:hypothetical protein